MLDPRATCGLAERAAGEALRLRTNLLKVEGALAFWDDHGTHPERVAAPLVSRETLLESRAMLLEDLARETASGTRGRGGQVS